MERPKGPVLTSQQKRILAVAILGGGGAALVEIRSLLKAVRKEQQTIFGLDDVKTHGKASGSRIQVDKRFLVRLGKILSLCVPGLWSREAALIAAQGGLLVSRTLLTEVVSTLEGISGRHITNGDWPLFVRSLLKFAGICVPAALVNAGLKLMQKQLQLAWSSRITRHLHEKYCENKAFYAASVLNGLSHADQRITEDVENFCFTLSELFSYTFKPLLDIALFTRTLSRTMGYRAQLTLYAYYLGVGALLRATAPPLARMVAQESSLTASFRAAHQRLVSHAEEVAFNDPPAGAAERMILNQHLGRLLRYSHLSSLQRFFQQVNDQYFVKYMASIVSLGLYALFQYSSPDYSDLDLAQRTERYIKTVRLLSNTSRGIGDLMLVYKRVAGLAGHTSRVSELLEAVERLSNESHHEAFRRRQSHQGPSPPEATDAGTDPRRQQGEAIAFEDVAVDSPDGTPLVRHLTFSVLPGRSVIIMGPNGSGKSSLLRCLAGLWPHQAGVVTSPPKGAMFYLAQRPYLVSGSLRDQLLYPMPPSAVWASARKAERDLFPADYEPPTRSDEAHLLRCIEAVELEYLLSRHDGGWEAVKNWQEILSGGKKQRLAMARLLYHKPKYAILDECTSAVSADGEAKLYKAVLAAGITACSIAHRPQLRKFHSIAIVFEGMSASNPKGWRCEYLDSENCTD
uniref:ATP-binding cassette, subfamily D (ALD), member 3 n=1 Tax=Tetraselmis sp. GSL018 TaxID=582737 RepID=A0A061SM41_9CHLO|mmetsp:Transcript_17442/g.41715  ORF Transcript_17442/g.41715 Transcript_17442/m.41715 type:complete len:685 (-) Transcript_17442:212-2266(-)|eukprot:CAMPEP_0177581352 /NCGR_PEP_ID=MMETSP0419_2-20121207/2098_1 /TAXON_ID=582737 /ORGANISM="Tetraselmis sp., Strain GSL018" /LENGTH=684 /DNA_ID=CAMNT_0019070381 /DNA_START=59 /DNA_END=2113 /DNA_ORIENTATION=-